MYEYIILEFTPPLLFFPHPDSWNSFNRYHFCIYICVYICTYEKENIQCVFSQTDNGYHYNCVKTPTSSIWTN
jgi:hypothetical protein